MNYAIILASGQGKRMNNSTPKQFLLVNDNPILSYTISAFEKCNDIDEIIIVSKKQYFTEIYQIIDKYNFNKVHMLVQGGKTRQASSYNALFALQDYASNNDIILIHDAARPLVDSEEISILIKKTKKHKAVVLTSAITNTIINYQNGEYKGIINRKQLLNAETPQSFTYKVILKAHEYAKNHDMTTATDDAQLVYNTNKKIYVVKSDKPNIKVTTSNDLELLKIFLKDRI